VCNEKKGHWTRQPKRSHLSQQQDRTKRREQKYWWAGVLQSSKGENKNKNTVFDETSKKAKKKSEERRNVHQCFYTECCSTKLCQSLDVKSLKKIINKEQKLNYHLNI